MQFNRSRNEGWPLVTGHAVVLERSEGGRLPYAEADTLTSVQSAYVATLDREGTIIVVNESWNRVAHVNGAPGLAEGGPGMNYLGVCRQSSRTSAQEGQDAAAGIQAVLEGTQSVFALEYSCHLPSEQRWFLLQAIALPGDEGGAIVSHVNITEHKQATAERARLLAHEQAAHAEAEAAREEAEAARVVADAARAYARATVRNLRRLHLVTDAALRHLALDDLLHALLDRVQRVMSVDSASILLITEEERNLSVRIARGVLPSEEVHIAMGKGVAGRIAASRQPLVIDDISKVETVSSALQERLSSLAGVPLLIEGRLIGVLHVGTVAPRRFTSADVQFLELVGDRIAPALERARLYEEAQAARQQAEAQAGQLRAIFDSMSDSLVVFDHQLRILQTNAADAEMFGFGPKSARSPSTLPARMRLLKIRDAQGRRVRNTRVLFSRILQGETVKRPNDEDFIVRTLHGQELVISASGAPIRDANGQITGGVLVVRDVTERRQVEGELAARANELATLVEAMTDGVLLCDRQGRILQANQALRNLIALRDTLGVPEDISNGHGPHLLPAQLPMHTILQGAVLQGSTAIDVSLQALDGREVDVNVSGAPVRNAAGQITGAVGVFREVTERRQLERRTRQGLHALVAMARMLVSYDPSVDDQAQEAQAGAVALRLAELTRGALECANVGIIALDPGSDVLHPLAVASDTPGVEEAWRASYRQVPHLTERFGPAVLACLHRDEVVVLGASHLNGVLRNRAYSKETWLIAPMCVGGRLVGLLRLDYGKRAHDCTEDELALAGAVGRLTALVLERERLQREREEALTNELAMRLVNQRMDEFLAVASHDLRQPATSSSGYVQLAVRRFRRLESEMHPAAKKQAIELQALESNLTRAAESLDRLSELVSRLFDMSRIRSGHFDLRPASIDLAALVRAIVEEQRVAAPGRIIHLDLPAGQTLCVEADAVRIGQVVSNYLTNALRYSGEDRPIEVALGVDDTSARVSVKDEGPGIQADDLDRIWARFQRSRRSAPGDDSQAGLGLGLYISREIIERHGGKVGVESVVGHGSTFWFTLPFGEHESP